MAFPLIGNLHCIVKDPPHKSFFKLSQRYGQFFRFWMGDYFTVIVSERTMIRKIWVDHHDIIVNRIHIPSIKYSSRNYTSLAAGDDEYWRVNKSIVANAFTKMKIKQLLTDTIEKQTKQLIKSMKTHEQNGKPFYPRKYIKKFAMNIILNYTLSEEIPFEEGVDSGRVEKLIEALERFFANMGQGHVEDFFKLLEPLYGVKCKIFGNPIEEVIEFLYSYFEEHIKSIDWKKPRDLLDTLIIECRERNLDPDRPLVICNDFFFAGTETTSSSMDWFILLMANNPSIQQRLFNELLEIKKNQNQQQPDESTEDFNFITLKDKNEAIYFNAVIKETLRYKCIAPLGVPRQSSEDIIIDDYIIPKGTMFIQNIYTLCHSTDYWVDPFVYNPGKRFIKDEILSETFIPFGIGQRGCIGQTLAMEELYCACSHLILNFEISPFKTEKIDETEAHEYGHFFKLSFGEIETVIVSNPVILREIWIKHHDQVLDRLDIPTVRLYSYNFRNLGGGSEPYWSTNKKIVGSAFSRFKIKQMLSETIERQTKLLIKSMKDFTINGTPVKEIPFEEGVDSGRIKKLIDPLELFFKNMGQGHIEDYFKILSPLFYLKSKIFGNPVKQLNEFIEVIYKEHLKVLDFKKPRDLLDSIIIECQERKMDSDIPIILATDFFLTGTDTTSSTMEWFMILMANNPNVQQKAFNELWDIHLRSVKIEKVNKILDPEQEVEMNENKISEPFITLNHKTEAIYFNAVIKETMRYKCIAPLGVPRQSSEDIEINGYLIPKGAQLVQNIYTLCNSPDYWVNPQIFIPERFINDNHSDTFIPFGIGYRNCVGQMLAIEELFSACANLILNFEITPKDNSVEKIDESPVSEEIPFDESVESKRMKNFMKSIDKFFENMGQGNIADVITILSPFFYLKNYIYGNPMEEVNSFIKSIYDRYRNLTTSNSIDKQPRDVLEKLMCECDERELDWDLPIVNCSDIFFAGAETTSSSIEWFIMMMANYPIIQKKVFEEVLEINSGGGKFISLVDASKAKYLNATVKEVIRYKSVVPLGVPRQSTEDFCVDGYCIPKGTHLIINFHTLSHSPDYWIEPSVFNPDRFLVDYNPDVFIPFGIGPRSCIGQMLAIDEIMIACANLILNFEISSNIKIDENRENFGLAISPKPFQVFFNPRKSS
eukprot:gene5211-6489_t